MVGVPPASVPSVVSVSPQKSPWRVVEESPKRLLSSVVGEATSSVAQPPTSKPDDFSSQVNLFILSHPHLAVNQQVRFNLSPHSSKDADSPLARTSQSTWPRPDIGPVIGHESLKPKTVRFQGSWWGRMFNRIGSSHPVDPEFDVAIVAPNLQFTDRLLESFFTHEFYRKRMRSRVHFMGAFGILLIIFQLWLGFANAARLRQQQRHSTTTTPAPYIGHRVPNLFMIDTPTRVLESCTTILRRLWGTSVEPNNTERMSFYTLACVDQAVVDMLILIVWMAMVNIPNMISRMEVVSVVTQLIRTVLLIFFSQGMYGPCGQQQGPTDVIMNNLAVASANTTVFNCLGIARVRRSCFITLAWLAGVVEVCTVMSQGGQSVRPEDVPQLALFILMFTIVPIIALWCRYRAEMSERESLHYAVLLEHQRHINTTLTAQLTEMAAVRDLDIEQALPEGVVPSQIVHVAVMELKIASKTADALHTSLPNLLSVADGPPASSVDPFKAPSSHRGLLTRHTERGPPFLPLNRRETSGWTRMVDHEQGLSTTQNLGVVLEATIEVKARIASALKLLSRSHDLYTARPTDPYHGAMMFHALGHDVSAYHKTFHGSASTSRLQSTAQSPKTSRLTVSPSVTESGPSSTTVDFPHLQHMPFLSGLGDIARNVGQNWNFDLLKVTKVTKDQALATTAMLLASPIAEKLPWVFDWVKFNAFIRTIQSEYGPSDKIPYHNRTHAAIHGHTTTVLLTWFNHGEVASPLEQLSVLIASLCHDVGHPGKTNAYLVNANRRLAIVYNDISVLENLHACRTFETLQMKESNFLAGAENDDYRFFRKLVIDLILATDMKLHFELFNSFVLRRSGAEFQPLDDENRTLTLKLIMKAADLSHGALDWPIHQQLSMAVNEEFWAQGDAEEKLGLPKSPLCDRSKAHELAGQQVAFLEFVVLPLYQELAAVDLSGLIAGTCESSIKQNISKWKVVAASQMPTETVASPTSIVVPEERIKEETTPPGYELVSPTASKARTRIVSSGSSSDSRNRS